VVAGEPPPVTARAWALFTAMSLVWGIPYLFIKIAVDHGLAPLLVAWGRVALGALVLLPIAWRTGALRGLGTRARWIATFALFEIVIPFPLISYGEVHVASSLTAILIAALPLIVAAVTLRVEPEERVSASRLAGMLCGLAGVVLLVGFDLAGDSEELLGAACIMVATCGYAIGPMIIRHRLSALDPRGVAAAALTVGAVVLAPSLALAPGTTVDASAIASVAVLGVVCSALAFVLFFALIVEAGPTRAAVITYINPAVAVLLGVLILDERLGAASIAGLVLILAGSWISTRGQDKAEEEEVVGAGFEPAKAEPTGLQPVPFDRSGTPPGGSAV
jgi:drug/metabolite transporter (DMT)-like permease